MCGERLKIIRNRLLIKDMENLSKELLKDGMKVSCVIGGTVITDGIISINGYGNIFICQDLKAGAPAIDLKGKIYSWCLGLAKNPDWGDVVELKQIKEFGLSDLKTGMRVQYRNGQMRIVMKNMIEEDTFAGVLSFNGLRSYKEDFINKWGLTSFDIVKVFEAGDANKLLTPEAYGDLIWEREVIKEIPFRLQELQLFLSDEYKVVAVNNGYAILNTETNKFKDMINNYHDWAESSVYFGDCVTDDIEKLYDTGIKWCLDSGHELSVIPKGSCHTVTLSTD